MRPEQCALNEVFALIMGKELSSVLWVVRELPASEIFVTGASFKANVNLLVQVTMGLALIAGAFLARAKRYSAHGICQSAVLLLNVALIAYVMWPSFYEDVVPVLPHHLTDGYYGVATAHGFLAVSAELFGLYLLLVASTSILPSPLRVQRLKLWMRVELGLWWISIVTGVLTYYAWYAGS
jgi:uncharacterized membrane protein YozB (DUF420 family)